MKTFREREYSIHEVGVELGINSYEVFKLINAGELIAYKKGRHYRVTPKQLEAYQKKGKGNGDV